MNRTDARLLVVDDSPSMRVCLCYLLRAIRKGSRRRLTPVLLLAGSVSHGNLHEAVEAGATGFIPKPFFNPSLSEQVTSLIASIPYAPLFEDDFGDLEDPQKVHANG